MNTRRLISVVAAAAIASLGTAAYAEEVSGLTSGDPVSVAPREQAVQVPVQAKAADAKVEAIRAEGRAQMLDKLRNPGRIAEYNFGPSATQTAYKTEAAPSTNVAQH